MCVYYICSLVLQNTSEYIKVVFSFAYIPFFLILQLDDAEEESLSQTHI